jgi:guanine deaminase
MTTGRLDGHVLSPLVGGGLRWEPSSSLGWADGLLVDKPVGPSVLEDEGLLLIPGLVDAHVHLPQYRVRGRFSDALLPWLREHIWPEEARFADRVYREAVAGEFRDGMIAAGTTAALVWGSPHEESAHTVLNDLAPLCVRGGDVLMDRYTPSELKRPTLEGLASATEHAARYGSRYALTPRFVPTCTPELLHGLGRLAAESDVLVQTHLAENTDEVAWVASLHPDARSYLDVYDQARLLGPSTVLAHCIHLDELDLARLALTRSWIAHCPSSNVALGSGRMPLEQVLAAGVNVALATDVGAGPDISMLDVMASFLDVQAGVFGVRPTLALELATLRGAQAMGEGVQRGSLEPGRAADVVGLRLPGGLRRGETADEALARVLDEFAGRWDDAIAAVFIAGEQVA